MFIKIARVPIIALAEGQFDAGAGNLSFKRLASVKSASFYQENAQRLDIKTALALTASEYDISSNPADYIFEAVRAVTAEVPNENGDAFPRNELLRHDHRLGKAIYQTFIGKPHQVNHRAENPKTARGVVLDASYNDISPVLENCPACNHRTASPEGRDSTGINCVKCGTVVKDEFVELLLAIDTRKDPTFAEGVRTGALDSLSMGCEAGYTDCSICDNRARSAAQFCQHIRGGNKKKSFKTASGQERMAFEKCGDVVFTEISRVDQPADPKAKQQEVLKVAGLPLAVESEMLIMNARLAKLEQVSKVAQVQSGDPEIVPQVPFKNIAESIRWAETSIHRLKAEVHRLTSEKGHKQREAAESSRPFYAWESASYDAQIKANRQFVSRLEDYVAKAREMQAAGTPWEKGLTRQMSRFFANKEGQTLNQVQQETDQLQQLKVMHPEMGPQIDQLSGQGDVPGPMSIDDYAKEHEQLHDRSLSLGEMGMKPDDESGPALPVNVSAGKAIDARIAADLDALMDTVKESTVGATQNFANSYKHLEATVTGSGNVKVHTAAGTLFVVRPENRPTTKEAAAEVAREVLASIASEGLVGAVAKYDAIIGPKAAQILEHHLEDFAGGREKGDTKGMPEGGLVDHQDGRSKPEKSMVGEEHTDRKDETREKRNQSNSDVLEKHQPDHKEPLPSKLTPMTDQEHSDMADGHGKPSRTTLKQIMVDFKDKQPKSAVKIARKMSHPLEKVAGAVLAGGAVRNFIGNLGTPKDYDYFFLTKEAHQESINYLKSAGATVVAERPAGGVIYKLGGSLIDLAPLVTSADKIIAGFDITANQCYAVGSDVYALPDALGAIQSKTVQLANVHYPTSTFKRAKSLFSRYGFRLSDSDFKYLRDRSAQELSKQAQMRKRPPTGTDRIIDPMDFTDDPDVVPTVSGKACPYTGEISCIDPKCPLASGGSNAREYPLVEDVHDDGGLGLGVHKELVELSNPEDSSPGPSWPPGEKTSMDVCANEMCSMHPGKKEAGGDCGCAPNCGCQCGCKCASAHEAQGAPHCSHRSRPTAWNGRPSDSADGADGREASWVGRQC
jgi:hypothetical protein